MQPQVQGLLGSKKAVPCVVDQQTIDRLVSELVQLLDQGVRVGWVDDERAVLVAELQGNCLLVGPTALPIASATAVLNRGGWFMTAAAAVGDLDTLALPDHPRL